MDFDKKFTNLFAPITLGGTFFRNRIFASPTGYQDVDEHGTPSPEAKYYYARKAIGGAASVTVGECNVDASYGSGNEYFARLDDPFAMHGLAKIAGAVKRAGAVCSAELMHSGMYANRWTDPPRPAYGPVDCEVEGREVRAMDEAFIEYTIEKYAAAAAAAKAAGFGMVTVHAGHGWLFSQFLSPKLNTRKDEWGGESIENRTRILLRTLDAIRARVGRSFPIEVRISGSEVYDGGYDIEEGIRVAKMVDGHADLLHVSVGSHEVDEVFTVTHPSLFLPDGCNVKYAAEIKKHVKMPVATVGALADPVLMEEIIASGQADVVEVARGLLADPDLPLKARSGRASEIRTCMRCLACFSELINTGNFSCAINPEIGREHEPGVYDKASVAKLPPEDAKKVLVVGGGVGGMEAALELAKKGHEVTLCEKSDRLGGILLCEEDVSFKRLLAKYLAQQAELIKEAGVDVRLGTEVDVTYAEAFGADVIVAALGAEPVLPAIPGIKQDFCISAEACYKDTSLTGARVVILGAGLVGVELGIWLAMQGRKVSIVEMLDGISDGGNFQHLRALEVKIAELGIELSFGTKAVSIEKGVVRCELLSSGVERTFEADTVVYAVGQRPHREAAAALSRCSGEYHVIGDCESPKNIMNAVAEAYEIARIV